MSFASLHDHDKVVSIPAIRNCWFPLSVFSHRYRDGFLNTEVPCPTTLSGFLVQVFRFQPHIKLLEHDVGQERRKNAASRNTFIGSPEQATINVTCFQDTPEQTDKPFILNAAAHTADQ